MKRSAGPKRKTALAPGGPLARKGSRPGRGAPIKPVNRRRAAANRKRNFGHEADAVRAMPCSTHRALAIRGGWGADEWMIDEPWPEGWTPCTHHASDAAHVEPRGMGACNGDGRFGLVPLCRTHHEEAGEARTSQRAAFEARYGLDLRREADRIAVGHGPPLGIRGLAERWCAAVEDMRDRATSATCNVGPEPPAEHEIGALMGWVRREMEREVDRRRVIREATENQRHGFGFVPHASGDGAAARSLLSSGHLKQEWLEDENDDGPDTLGFGLTRTGAELFDDNDDNDREALAYRIMQALGAPFTEDTHGEHGLAWTLCEAAGWPS